MEIETLLRALGEPTRLRIMRLLAHMELAVGELAQVLGQSQPRISRHIRILCEAGLATRHREGSWVFLRQAIGEDRAPPLGALAAQMLETAEREDASFAARCAEDRRHLAAIRSTREEAAQAYFAAHAADWDTLRTMHSPDEPVERALAGALGAAPLGNLLDIGTGTGRMAELFADDARHITAVDKSTEMLRIARARLQTLPPDRIELLQADFAALPFADASFDTVLFHQVLHYAADPRIAIREAARVLAPEGRIAIVDFAAHEHEELRSRHAHARLGFSDEQMISLLSAAGLACETPIALPGDPLTVKIWIGRSTGDVARAVSETSVRAARQ